MTDEKIPTTTRKFVVTLVCDDGIDPIEVADYLLDYLCDNSDPDCFYVSCDGTEVVR